jgi:hypothetical protein
MKKTLKLSFTDTNEQIASFFISTLSQKYDVIIDHASPSYLIFGDTNFGENNLRYDPSKVIKIFYTGENQRPENYQSHYAISFDHLENDKHYRLPLYVIYDFDNHKKGLPSAETFNRQKIDIDRKTEFCSFVVRNPNCTKRNDFFHKLTTYKTVHSGGPLFNNIGYVLPYGDEAPRAKIEWMNKYKFNLCFENSSHPGYATEKLYEALLGNTVPIYWGSPTIEVDFNPKAFLNWYDYKNDDDFLDAIIELDNDDEKYMDMYLQPMFMNDKNRFMKIDNFLRWFDENVYKDII